MNGQGEARGSHAHAAGWNGGEGIVSVLLVAEDAGQRRTAAQILSGAGYKVLEAFDQAQAQGLIEDSAPDLVVAELTSSTAPDALALCASLRQSRSALAPLLHIGRRDLSLATRIAALEAGQDAFLEQPVPAELLLATASSLLRRQSQRWLLAPSAERLPRSASPEDRASGGPLAESLQEGLPHPLAYIDRDLRFVHANRAFLSLFGVTLDWLAGRPATELLTGAEESAALARAIAAARPVHFGERPLSAKPGQARDPELRYWDWTLAPVQDAGGRVLGLVFSLVEMTEQVRAREQLEQQRARMEAILRQMPAGVLVAEAPSGRLLLANERLREIWRCEDISTENIEEQLQRFRGMHRDGRVYRPEEWPLARALREGEVVRNEEIDIIRCDGTSGTLLVSASPIYDRDGQIVAAVVTYYDDTGRRRREREREAIVHVISHDLRIPLTIINGYMQLLTQAKMPIDTGSRVSVEGIGVGVRRLNVMVNDLEDSLRLESGQLHLSPQAVDLAAYVEGILERTAGIRQFSRVKLVRSEEPLPPAAADPDRIERILLNLLTNSLKYSPPDSEVIVRVDRSGDDILVSVSDAGGGIPPEDLARLFDRFYRATSSRGTEGWGLGLFIAKMLVEAHRGHIWVETGRDQGSTFRFTIPVAREASRESRQAVGHGSGEPAAREMITAGSEGASR